jgi:hypothetical protein
MNLEHLRTPNPLTEFDYAAVRARVHSKLAERRRWTTVFRFASAFAAVVLVMLSLIPADSAVVPAAVPRAALKGFSGGQAHLPVRAGGTGRSACPPLTLAAPQRIAVTRPARRHKARTIPTEVARIEIHTADPDIRIIWIVPKENS